MTISMYAASVPVFIRMLGNLAGILEKAATHAEARQFDPAVLLASRLSPGMYPLVKQVRIASDAAVDAAARLAQVVPPVQEETEQSFPELIARIRDALTFLETLRPEQFAGAEDRIVSWRARGTTITLHGMPYLLNHAQGKFYFHLATAYAILRHNGVEIGKGDFLGRP